MDYLSDSVRSFSHSDAHEASLLVTDFTIFVFGSSCNYPFFIHVLALSVYLLASPRLEGMSRKRLIKKRRENETKKIELHELPYTENAKFQILGLLDCPPDFAFSVYSSSCNFLFSASSSAFYSFNGIFKEGLDAKK